MVRSGTLVICLQNLDFSGANQVVLNIVSGRIHESNVVVLSPTIGSFAARFVDTGVAVRIGDIDDLLKEIRNVFCVICNTIMTCHTVNRLANRNLPVIWILHEWWDDKAIDENLQLRNIQHLSLATVKEALAKATRVVTVCASQKRLYNPAAATDVIFVGVPDPFADCNDSEMGLSRSRRNTEDTLQTLGMVEEKPFTCLCLGIVCPRKNQHWTVEVFKAFSDSIPDGDRKVRLVIVGARYTRVYEVEYLHKLKGIIGDSPNIELHDVTSNVEDFFQQADCLIITSLNEVTPMVISEAMSYSIPVISTNIAGIKEMYTDGVEGYLLDPGDREKAIYGLTQLYNNSNNERSNMSYAARERFETTFDVDIMVKRYRHLLRQVAAPVILVDMDGTFVDWDKGFTKAWKGRSPIDRSRSYYMEQCVGDGGDQGGAYYNQALGLMHEKAFFMNLPPMDGALQALLDMEAEGLKVYFISSPVAASKFALQDKIEWVKHWLGSRWLDRLIFCKDKTKVKGDILIDDKVDFGESESRSLTLAVWKQIVFDAPYNRLLEIPRLDGWKNWRQVVLPLLDNGPTDEEALAYRTNLMRISVSYKGKDRKSARKKNPTPGSNSDSNSNFQSMHDQLQTDYVPLSAEDIAALRTGSTAQLDEGTEDLAAYDYNQRLSGESNKHSLAAIQREIQDRKVASKARYIQQRQANEASGALGGDAGDVEGVLLFKNSYKIWSYVKKQVKKTFSSKSGESSSAAVDATAALSASISALLSGSGSASTNEPETEPEPESVVAAEEDIPMV